MSEPSIFFSEVNRRQGDFNRRACLLGGITGLLQPRWLGGCRTAWVHQAPACRSDMKMNAG